MAKITRINIRMDDELETIAKNKGLNLEEISRKAVCNAVCEATNGDGFMVKSAQLQVMMEHKVRCNIWIPHNLRVEAKERGISISKVTTEALKTAIDAAVRGNETKEE